MFKEERKYSVAAKIVVACLVAAALIALPLAGTVRASLLDKLQWKVEKHFGRATVAEMQQTYGFVSDPMLRNYINNLGKSLAEQSHRTDIPYEFYIVDTDEVNAFAAPGGFIFVTRGLMEEADTEDELAAVIGHEVGHVAAHHGAKNIKKVPFIMAGMAILQGKAGETAARVVGTAFSLMQLHYSREDEYEADSLGAEYSSAADYDPDGMVSFFKKLERKHPSGNLGRLEVAISSHPKTTNRMSRIGGLPQLQPIPENLLRIADSYYDRFYYTEAREKYEEALEHDPENARAAAGIARSLFQLGDDEGAREWFTVALGLDPDNEEARSGLKQVAVPAPDSEEERGITTRAPADEKTIQVALGHVRKNIPHLEKTSSLSSAGRKEIDEPLYEVKSGLLKNIRAYSSIAQALANSYDPRAEAVETAAANFDGMMYSVELIDQAANDIPALAEDTARYSREITWRLQHAERINRDAVQAAEDLDSMAASFAVEQQHMLNSLSRAANGLETSYKETHNVFAAVADTFDEEDAGTIGYFARRMNDNAERTSERLEWIYSDTEEAAAELEKQKLRLRRAVLNFDAALLSPRQEVIFRKMLERRFGITTTAMGRLTRRGVGYADILLLASSYGTGGPGMAAALDSLSPGGQSLDSFLVNDTTDVSSGMLLISMALKDLMMLTGRNPEVDLEQEPAPSAATALSGTGEEDEELANAAAALDAGRPEEAAGIIHQRGRSHGATAASHMLLGMAYNGQDSPAEAIDEFKYAVKKNHKDINAHILLANTFSDQERYDDAANELAAALELAPEDTVIISMAAYNDAMLGQIDSAVSRYTSIVDAGEASPGVYQNLGLLYYQEGFIGKAIEAFREAVRIDPQRERLAALADKLEKS